MTRVIRTIRMAPLRLAMFGGAIGLATAAPAAAQSLGFGPSPSGKTVPVSINASKGIVWNQKQRTVTAIGAAKAVRGDVTVTADRLIAHYAKRRAAHEGKTQGRKAQSGGTQGGATQSAAQSPGPLAALDSGQSKLTELEAVGDVHIYSKTDQAWGAHAVYRMQTGELDLTGNHIRFTTPTEAITAQRSLSYYPTAHKARAVGDATIVTKDQRSIRADTLIGWFRPQAGATGAASGGNEQGGNNQGGSNRGGSNRGGSEAGAETQRLRKVVAIGHVMVRTAEDIATGEHGVYRPATGIAVLTGHVHITHGPNELAGETAVVNMKTGIATLAAGHHGRVQGLILPNSAPPSAAESPQSKGRSSR